MSRLSKMKRENMERVNKTLLRETSYNDANKLIAYITDRFSQYGYKKNGLRHKKYRKYNPISSQEKAMKIEVELAEKLRKKGHCVYQK